MTSPAPPPRSVEDAPPAHRSLASGSVAVAFGVAINGVATYLFLAVTQRALTPAQYGAFAVVWGLTLVAGPGIFHPLEQELARATADREARGFGSGPVLRSAALIASGLGLLVALGCLVAWPLGLRAALDDEPLLAVAAAVALGGYAIVGLARGVLGGVRSFSRYGRTMAVEGGLRVLAAGALLVVGVERAWPFALWIGVASIGAAIVGRGRQPLSRSGPTATVRELTPNLGLLLAMSSAEAILLNVGPILVEGFSADEAAAGRFLNALVVGRLPLFLFVAVRVALLPNLTYLAASGEWEAFRVLLRRLVLGLTFAVPVLAGAAAVGGPWVVRLLFGTHVSAMVIAVLAAASAVSMVVILLALALIAASALRGAAAGWWIGIIAFGALLLLGGEPMARVAVATVGAMTAAAVAMGVAMAGVLRRARRSG